MENTVYSKQDKLHWYHWTIFLAEMSAALFLIEVASRLISSQTGEWSSLVIRGIGGLFAMPLFFIKWASSARRMFFQIPVLKFNDEGIQYLRGPFAFNDRIYATSSSPIRFSDLDKIEQEFVDRVVIWLKRPLNDFQGRTGRFPVIRLVVAGNEAGLRNFLSFARTRNVAVNDGGLLPGASQDREIAVLIAIALGLLLFLIGTMTFLLMNK